MTLSTAHPKWWQIYLIFPLLIVLFILDHQLKISTRGHQAVQIGIVLIVYGLIHLWLRANATALAGMDREQAHGRILVIQVPSSPPPGPVDEHSLLSELSGSEIKGMLSDTFEMDYIDAQFSSVDKASQESKKE